MYQEMIQFVQQTLEERETVDPHEYDAIFPFRNRFQHILRMYKWALRLQEVLGGDREIIAIAAIFHDVGKGSIGRHHAEVGAEIADAYLQEMGYPDERRERVVKAIRNHSSKKLAHTLDLSLEEQIIMDADGLDEVGAISVVWDAMAVALGENPSYEKVLDRMEQFQAEMIDTASYFNTEAARQIYLELLRVREQFVEDLRYELGRELICAKK